MYIYIYMCVVQYHVMQWYAMCMCMTCVCDVYFFSSAFPKAIGPAGTGSSQESVQCCPEGAA